MISDSPPIDVQGDDFRAGRVMVLIPAYNEAERIAQVVKSVRAVLPEGDVVVVDDGSCDRTARMAREAGAAVIRHPFNMGYGAAIQTGYKYADRNGYDRLVQLDGDGQHEAGCILDLLAPLERGEADFVLGSRFLDKRSYRPPALRRIGMAFFRRIVSLSTGQDVTDSTSGFQSFNRRVVRFFAQDHFPCDYPDADMLITLHRAGFRITEVPVRMREGAAGKSMHAGLKPLYYLFKMLLSISVTLLREAPKEPPGE